MFGETRALMEPFKRWLELLAPTVLALIVFGSMMHTRVTMVEAQVKKNGETIEKMRESWVSRGDVRELKDAIKELTLEVNKLKVEVAKGS